ncbi:hypothetical protein MSG28_011332 [Choristoneura fumiferana]|uniref:Uncharacterized protein n=1 Tax=Choristoneura fumiferana TaxID=7141 RepID=A0ACC0JN27_CHOFU|nr:hypothetical protein MSG28_011332 [Choristoneura fumiferana]
MSGSRPQRAMQYARRRRRQPCYAHLRGGGGGGGGAGDAGRDFVIERERERDEVDRPRRQGRYRGGNRRARDKWSRRRAAAVGRGHGALQSGSSARPAPALHSSLAVRGAMARMYHTLTRQQWEAVLTQMSAQLGRGERDDASSTGSERLYEQDIAILNRCFDDIEKFIARLQHAAAAGRELERRRRSRGGGGGGGGGGKRGAGDGMLALRTRPPPERDFVDVLQKFKLSFNLLARLRAHIHDPNAPELVHFLFTPLALIVDAAQDAEAGAGAAAGAGAGAGAGPLPARVVQPLLTRDALNLLANCVTSKETELWHSLGDAWLIPREQWKANIPPYQPVFMDGWSPDYQAWARGVAARGGRVVRVTYPRTANNDKELSVVRGEYLEVLDDSRKWWRARNRRGVTAHVPHTIVAATPDPTLYPNPIYTHYQEGGGRGSGGSSPTSPAGRAREGPREGRARAARGPRAPPTGCAGSASARRAMIAGHARGRPAPHSGTPRECRRRPDAAVPRAASFRASLTPEPKCRPHGCSLGHALVIS